MKASLTTDILKHLKPAPKPYDVRDGQVTGFLVRVEPSGSKNYYVTYGRPRGGRSRQKIGEVGILPLPKARKAAREFLAKVQLGEDPADARRKAKAANLGQFLNELYGPWARANRKRGEQTTQRLLSAFDMLLSKRLHELTPWTLERWRTQRRKQRKKGREVKNGTLNRDIACLRAALNLAVKWHILDANPMKGLERLPERDSKQVIRFLSQDEENRLWAVLDVRDDKIREARASHNLWLAKRGYPLRQNLHQCRYADYLRPMIELSLNTGLRRNELFSLEWRDIDLDKAILTVRGEIAKSGRIRHIPLNSAALECLTAWRAQTRSRTLVFVNPSTRHRFDNVQSTWERVRAAAGLTDFRWHDFRHTFASRLVMHGVDLNTVRELLGHASIDMVLRYAHLAPEAKQQAVDRLASNVIPFPAKHGASEAAAEPHGQ